MKQYFDTESGAVISAADLETEYKTLFAAGDTECKTYTEYVRACTGKHGTLVAVVDTENEVIL